MFFCVFLSVAAFRNPAARSHPRKKINYIARCLFFEISLTLKFFLTSNSTGRKKARNIFYYDFTYLFYFSGRYLCIGGRCGWKHLQLMVEHTNLLSAALFSLVEERIFTFTSRMAECKVTWRQTEWNVNVKTANLAFAVAGSTEEVIPTAKWIILVFTCKLRGRQPLRWMSKTLSEC